MSGSIRTQTPPPLPPALTGGATPRTNAVVADDAPTFELPTNRAQTAATAPPGAGDGPTGGGPANGEQPPMGDMPGMGGGPGGLPTPPATTPLPAGAGGTTGLGAAAGTPPTPAATTPAPAAPATPAVDTTPAHPGTPAAGAVAPAAGTAATTPTATASGSGAATPVTATGVTGADVGTADALGGPRGERNFGTKLRTSKQPIKVTIGLSSFSMPPVAVSNRKVSAPRVTFGKNWTDKGGGVWMASNGTKARVATQARVSVGDPSKITIVKTPLGGMQQLPDGSYVGISSKTHRPVTVPKGMSLTDAAAFEAAATPLPLGTRRIGGLQVRAFEATTVNVTTPEGRFMRYDSRGNVRLGRGALAGAAGGGAVGAASGAAATTGGGTTDPAPTKTDPAPAKGTGATTVAGSGTSGTPSLSDITASIQAIIPTLQALISSMATDGTSDAKLTVAGSGTSTLPNGLKDAVGGLAGLVSDDLSGDDDTSSSGTTMPLTTPTTPSSTTAVAGARGDAVAGSGTSQPTPAKGFAPDFAASVAPIGFGGATLVSGALTPQIADALERLQADVALLTQGLRDAGTLPSAPAPTTTA